MELDDAPRAAPDSAKRRDQTWVVWALLAAGAAVAVYTATRTPHRVGAAASEPSATVKKTKKPKRAEPAASSVARSPVRAASIEAASLVSEACAGKPADDCLCREQAAQRALTLGAPDSALSVVRASSAGCQGLAGIKSLEGEALVRFGKVDEAVNLVPQVLALDPKNASVPYIRAVAALKRGDSPTAAREATAAIDLGRGAPAHVALGLASFQDSELDAAEASFKRALESSPDDVDARYNLAVIDQRRNRYTASRTGYLRVLRVRPDHLDARHNLVLLTLAAGAAAEAKHHLQKLEEAAPPGDPRVAQLASALQKSGGSPLPVMRAPAQAHQ